MPQPIQIASATAPGNPDVKDNEDRYATHVGDGHFAVVVCDGVSQRVGPDGAYPRSHASAAAFETVNVFENLFARAAGPFTVEPVMKALCAANTDVYGHNKRTGKWDIDDWKVCDRSATTVVCAIGRRQFNGRIEGYTLSLGDPLAIAVGAEAQPLVLAQDQLAPSRRWRKLQNWSASEQAIWSRSTARNNINLREDGVALGYGVIDGNHEFMHFINIQPFVLPKNGVLMVASDALRVLGSPDDSDDPTGYQWLTCDLLNMPVGLLPDYLISQTRAQERKRKVKHDDATVVVIKN